MSVFNSSKLDCVLVHGWGMNSAVWQDCLSLLPDWLNVIRVDLPGHGSMAGVGAGGLDDYVQAMVSVTRQPALWVGWSLGGLAVLRLAGLHPERVAGLFMVASNPCFVRREDWPCAVENAVFEAFAGSLEQDVDATIKRFLALQVRGTTDAMKTVRRLQAALQQRGRADIEALRLGLDILQHADLRQELAAVSKPVGWLLGERDTLVPVALAAELKTLNPAISCRIAAHAAHAPFISQPQHFVDALVEFAAALK